MQANFFHKLSCQIYLKGYGTRVALGSPYTRGPLAGTGPEDQGPVNRPILVKKTGAGTEFWSPKLVPQIQTGLN